MRNKNKNKIETIFGKITLDKTNRREKKYWSRVAKLNAKMQKIHLYQHKIGGYFGKNYHKSKQASARFWALSNEIETLFTKF